MARCHVRMTGGSDSSPDTLERDIAGADAPSASGFVRLSAYLVH